MTDSPHTPQPGRGPDDRIRLADALRNARLQAGFSGAEAGRRAGMSQSKVSKIERRFLLPSVEDVAALCVVYDIPPKEREELVAIVTGLREEQSARVILSRSVAETQRRIGHLERSASLIRSFQPTMVIGLLQTPAYARCVFAAPDSQELSDDEVTEAVAVRSARQSVLEDDSKSFALIMTEGALRWQAGSPEVMAEQLSALADVASQNDSVGIIPWTTPVMHFPRHGFHIYDEDAVIVGTETATATITGAADVATYVELFTLLHAMALFSTEAEGHFTRIADDYRHLIGRL